MLVMQSTTVVLTDPKPGFEPLPSPVPLSNPVLEQSLSMRPMPLDTAYPFPAQSSVLGSLPVTSMPCAAMPYDADADHEDDIPLAYLAESLASRRYGPNGFEGLHPDMACQCPYCGRHRPSAGFLYNGEE